MLTLNDGRNELWQWDTKRKLTVDAECSQVHFSNNVFGRSIDVDVVDGVAEIPDILLQTDKDFTAWAFIGTAENGYTKISKVFKVNKRNKPADYVFTPTEQTTLAEIMERLDDLESIQDPYAIKNAVDDYLANNPIKVNETDPTVPEWAKQPNPPAVKIPDKLPNPYSITFTGAVNASYDGSNPIEIKIPDSGGNANQGAGLTATEKNLMLALFKAVPYTSDVSATMKSLEAIWNSGSSGGETPDIPDVTNYTVTYNLTSVTADSTPASVVEGGSLTVNLTPDTNAVMGEVIVTMGGVDVTATAYSNGKISISSVTGNVAITATATVANYTQVEYLESSNKAWIYAPYGIGSTDLVEATFYLAKTNWSAVWDSYQNTMRHALRIRKDSNCIGLTRRKAAAWSTYSPGVEDFTFPTTKVKFVETEVGKGTLYDADGNILYQTLEDTEVSTFTGTNQIVMFSMSSRGTNGIEQASGIKICEFIIKDVYGTVKRHFIPVLDENDVPCMYEKVSGEYFYNTSDVEGSAFIAGGAV